MEMKLVREICCCTETDRTVLHAGLAKDLSQPFVEESDVPLLGFFRRCSHVADQRRLVSLGSTECSITKGEKHVQIPRVSCNPRGS